MISIIVAVARNNAIGKNNDLLWHIPADMKMFMRVTRGHTVIMGKRTYQSLPKQPLPNRKNIVITDDPGDNFEGCVMVSSIDAALELCSQAEENFIIGGASVYAQFLPFTDRLYLTRVHKDFDGDVFFPTIDFSEWKLISSEDFPPDEKNDFGFSFLVYDRNR
jgi:dihydrofolate reductase